MNNEWDTIIWSDESRFLLFENDGQQWVWRRPHEKYDADCLVPNTAKEVMVIKYTFSSTSTNLVRPRLLNSSVISSSDSFLLSLVTHTRVRCSHSVKRGGLPERGRGSVNPSFSNLLMIELQVVLGIPSIF